MRSTNSQLLTRYPKLTEVFDPVSLGNWPTPVERLHPPTVQSNKEVWIKREDQSSSVYGGNKVRKLELLLTQTNRPVVTFGPLGSHHVLATALHARQMNRECRAVLYPQHMTPHHEEVCRLICHHCSKRYVLQTTPSSMIQLLRAASDAFGYMKSGERPVVIPPGGSNAAGVLGFVSAGLEISQQIDDGVCPEPTRVYVPLGSGGTAAGLALGLALGGKRSTVHAIRVVPRIIATMPYLQKLYFSAWKHIQVLGYVDSLPKIRLKIDHTFAGEGYAIPSHQSELAVLKAARSGIELETTYSGKAFAALLYDLENSDIDGPILFINTYGPLTQPTKN